MYLLWNYIFTTGYYMIQNTVEVYISVIWEHTGSKQQGWQNYWSAKTHLNLRSKSSNLFFFFFGIFILETSNLKCGYIVRKW